ncbi:hypothetical protein [Paenibacillus ehimensis]|uniref:hypothetical protein n=1 Tax=Paenibacillus ehimensis TaxID=79264 RepID=UPI000470A563|nr:hypothetical protein [Paenibacillus ehimensis]
MEVRYNIIIHLPETDDNRLQDIMNKLDESYPDKKVNIATITKLALAKLLEAYETDQKALINEFGNFKG